MQRNPATEKKREKWRRKLKLNWNYISSLTRSLPWYSHVDTSIDFLFFSLSLSFLFCKKIFSKEQKKNSIVSRPCFWVKSSHMTYLQPGRTSVSQLATLSLSEQLSLKRGDSALEEQECLSRRNWCLHLWLCEEGERPVWESDIEFPLICPVCFWHENMLWAVKMAYCGMLANLANH